MTGIEGYNTHLFFSGYLWRYFMEVLRTSNYLKFLVTIRKTRDFIRNLIQTLIDLKEDLC